ncbi:MAG: hypothetical protein FH751_06410 [Firmicutes bacterium]|nr:hypothetical protein [Bacillota bacterium]
MRKVILIILVIIIFIPLIGYTNGGPTISNPNTNGYLKFDDNSKIALNKEEVSFSYINKPSFIGEGDFSVKYYLENTSNIKKNIKIIFVTSSGGNNRFKVKVNGKDIKVKSYDSSLVIDNWKPVAINEIKEPVSGKKLSSLIGFKRIKGINKNYPGYIEIPLTFNKKESKILEINYIDFSALYRKEAVVNPVYAHLYYLTPAKFFKGEPEIKLKVKLPDEGNYKLSSNIKLEKINNNTYERTIKKIPKKEWLFSFTNTKNLYFDTNENIKHLMFSILVIVLLMGIFYIIQIKTKIKYIIPIGSILIFFFIKEVITKIKGGYGDVIYFSVFYILIGFTLYKLNKKAKDKF